MATPVDYSAEFPVDPKRLHDAITDQSYWSDRINEVGGEGATLEFGPDPEGDPVEEGWFSVRSSHVIPEDELPPMIAKMRSGNLVIERSEHWGGLEDGSAVGWFTVSVPGTPARLRGDAALSPNAAGGSAIHYSGEVKVSIPFLGAKIESTLSGQVVELLDKERDFTTTWLAAH
ncbi:Protein of unknown function DUF2505 [Segniliparus rotundus DSM 44985]|uniref:DUF2505 domain-containing protein n=1 Tax=Segniliparus rotundus (strain ATCC BAA-972 / CDC 1076 / CIP 108378 / DSM 44985 / JCM 13578) TaxID=640132 RepID=D6Z7M2_SEGRD|nr:DUF2505 domain-containing protein [Segniliparus rotundus]ADG97952.1 Protein of unknown function DUF2505 [Segniliparus rotundus DSM 44985]